MAVDLIKEATAKEAASMMVLPEEEWRLRELEKRVQPSLWYAAL